MRWFYLNDTPITRKTNLVSHSLMEHKHMQICLTKWKTGIYLHRSLLYGFADCGTSRERRFRHFFPIHHREMERGGFSRVPNRDGASQQARSSDSLKGCQSPWWICDASWGHPYSLARSPFKNLKIALGEER